MPFVAITPAQDVPQPAKTTPSKQNAPTPADLAKLTRQVAELQREVAALKFDLGALKYKTDLLNTLTGSSMSDTKKLKEDIDKLHVHVSFLDMMSHNPLLNWNGMTAEASFDPTETNPRYESITTDHGILFVSASKVESYLDGQRLFLQIGNPSLAQFTTYTLSLKWNVREPPHPMKIEGLAEAGPVAETIRKWQDTERSKDFEMTDKPLIAGRWTPVDVVLPATKGSDFGYVAVKIKITGIRFAN
jgi:hypothetical protein